MNYPVYIFYLLFYLYPLFFKLFSINFFIFLFSSALVNAAPSDKKDSSDEEENLKELAQAFQEKFNSTLFVDIIKMAEQAKTKCPDIENKIEVSRFNFIL